MIKIVIIEDDDPTRKVIAQILKGAGYEPCEAENGLKGLELIATVRPSLVLCDVEMPELTGYQTIRAVKENPATAALPFIFLSARNEKQDVTHGLHLKADDYLAKPFTAKELLSSVAKALGKTS